MSRPECLLLPTLPPPPPFPSQRAVAPSSQQLRPETLLSPPVLSLSLSLTSNLSGPSFRRYLKSDHFSSPPPLWAQSCTGDSGTKYTWPKNIWNDAWFQHQTQANHTQRSHLSPLAGQRIHWMTPSVSKPVGKLISLYITDGAVKRSP